MLRQCCRISGIRRVGIHGRFTDGADHPRSAVSRARPAMLSGDLTLAWSAIPSHGRNLQHPLRGADRRRKDRGRSRPGGAGRRSSTALAHRLEQRRLARKSSSLGWLFGQREQAGAPLKGLYVYGEVGRGKTMLMDLFFETSPVERKRRAHFHEFMADVHERVRDLPPQDQARRNRPTATRSGSPPTRSRTRPGCSASTNSTSPTSPTP